MNIYEGIRSRYSARTYLNRPVPREQIERILEAARWSPSWANTQPWEFHIASGDAWTRIQHQWLSLFDQDVEPHPDIAMPTQWPEALGQRAFALGAGLYSSLGVDRGDTTGRKRFRRLALQGFGAPVAVFLFQPAELTAWSVLDMGIAMGSLMLAAKEEGLDTCTEATMAHYPEVVREQLGISPDLRLICGLALGFADPEAAVNHRERTRAPLTELVRWYE